MTEKITSSGWNNGLILWVLLLTVILKHPVDLDISRSPWSTRGSTTALPSADSSGSSAGFPDACQWFHRLNPTINILLDLCLSNIALWDGSFVIVPGGGDCVEFSSMFCVLPDEKYVDVDGWIDEGGKWKEEEKGPLQSLGCFCELSFNVLQANLRHN